MIDLKSLTDKVNIKHSDWMVGGRDLHLIITDVNALMSVMLYDLLFRLEGTEYGGKRPEIDIIDDGEKVTKSDIYLGYFVQQDLGKNKVKVILERYSGVFTTTIYRITNEKEYMDSIQNNNILNKTTVVLGFGKNADKSNNFFDVILNKVMEKNTEGNLMKIYGRSDGDKLEVYTSVYTKEKEVLGEREIENVSLERKKKSKLVTENRKISNMMMNVFNLMVTDDAAIEGNSYAYWEQDMNTGDNKYRHYKSTSTIFKKRGTLSIGYLLNVGEEELKELSDNFEDKLRSSYDVQTRKENITSVFKKFRGLIKVKLNDLREKEMMEYEKVKFKQMARLYLLAQTVRGVKEHYIFILMMEEEGLKLSEIL